MENGKIIVKNKKGTDTYYMNGFERSNMGTCYHQRPIVRKGDKIKESLGFTPRTKKIIENAFREVMNVTTNINKKKG